MAQFVSFDPGVKVLGQSILLFVNAMDFGKEERIEILEKHGLTNLQPGEWYDLQKWLDAFKDLSEGILASTLYIIGKEIPSNAKFPPDIDTLEKALYSIDVAYKMNHTAGEIGTYEVTLFDPEQRKAIMVCRNPYPSDFDRGIIAAMTDRFKPEDSTASEVVLDLTKESRLNGGESCTYLISW
ncbi:hypothetical protein [Ohtaekwangia sp.]|uniref:hypothetical protein n=1 Tax=Ohtaekwangia sp. TaxID=2066019 RepID=UPI002F92FEC9